MDDDNAVYFLFQAIYIYTCGQINQTQNDHTLCEDAYFWRLVSSVASCRKAIVIFNTDLINVLPAPFKAGGPPGLILEKLKAIWLDKNAVMLENEVLCCSYFFFPNLCILITLVIKFSMFCLCYSH